jgi:multidrug efflux pump subunit AcrA (membrane-fusion protein)
MLMLVVGLGAAGMGIVWSPALQLVSAPSRASFIGPVQTEKVRKGLLRVTVNDDGNVESASNLELKCEVEGGSQILWIIDEGREVKEEDVLVRLNAATVEEEITQQMIVYKKAAADHLRAETEEAVARIGLKEYEDGTFKKELQTADANIVIAKENLKSSENLLRHNERMFRKGYVNRLQLETSQFAVERNKLELAAQSTARQVLVEFTQPKMVKELTSKLESAGVNVTALKAAADLEKTKLDRLQQQLASCTIKAPRGGMVVYANDRNSRGRESSIVEEGANVREMQTLIHLPDLTNMQVNSLIHETKVDKIRAGMPATIRIRGKELAGRVLSINNQPEPGNWFSSDVKEYAAKVSIDSFDASKVLLKPGMTAEVEILVKEIPDALQIPLLGVTQEGLENVCYVLSSDGYTRQPVSIGAIGTSFVEIKEGLTKDQEVILNPRACVAEAKERAEQAVLKMQRDQRRRARDNQSTDPNGTKPVGDKALSVDKSKADAKTPNEGKPAQAVGGGGDGNADSNAKPAAAKDASPAKSTSEG